MTNPVEPRTDPFLTDSKPTGRRLDHSAADILHAVTN